MKRRFIKVIITLFLCAVVVSCENTNKNDSLNTMGCPEETALVTTKILSGRLFFVPENLRTEQVLNIQENHHIFLYEVLMAFC